MIWVSVQRRHCTPGTKPGIDLDLASGVCGLQATVVGCTDVLLKVRYLGGRHKLDPKMKNSSVDVNLRVKLT